MDNRLPPASDSMQRQFPHTIQRVACQPCGVATSYGRAPIDYGFDGEGYRSEMPALRFRHQEVTESLHASDRLQFFRIDEIGIERDRVGFPEQLHERPVLLDQIVRQQGDTDAALTRAHDAEDIVDRERGLARALSIAGDLDQPAPVLEMIGHGRAAE